ncbi:MAG: hypothetical protein RR744_00480 [Cellulosilyticaceae bacterium]
MIVKVTLPIYRKVRKKDVLVGLNQVSLLHRYTKNKWKQDYDKIVNDNMTRFMNEPYDGKYEIEYLLYYKNVRCDLGNVCCIAEKFALDSLQVLGVLKDDNVSRHVRSTYTVGGVDKENPRVEMTIKRI